MSCEKSMRMRVAITALALWREDRRNVSGYASKLEYERFRHWNALGCCAMCDIFISFIISFGPWPPYFLPFQVMEVMHFPSHCHGSSSLWSAEILTDDELGQASMINNTLSENSNFFERWRDKSVAQETPMSLNKNNRGKYRSVCYNN